MMPALSLNTDTHHGLSSSFVTFIIVFFNKLFILLFPSSLVSCLLSLVSSLYSMIPLNVLCAQCSDHVCAMVSSSQSVGLRPIFLKYPCMAFISLRFRNSCPALLIFFNFLSFAP